MKKEKVFTLSVLMFLVSFSFVSAYYSVRSNTRVADGLSITSTAEFNVQPNGQGVYQKILPYKVNYKPANTGKYTFYVTYYSLSVSPDQSTVTQSFKNSKYSNVDGHEYFPMMAIPISY